MLCVILILLSIVIRYFLQFNNDLFLFYDASYVSSVAILHAKRKSRRYVMEHILQSGRISVQRKIYGRPSYFISLLLLIETSWHLSRRNMIFTALETIIVWLHDGRIFLRKLTEDRDRIKVSSRNADDAPCFFCLLLLVWRASTFLSSCSSVERYSRHIDSCEVCQSPTPSVRQEMSEHVHVQLVHRMFCVLSYSVVVVVFSGRCALSSSVTRQEAVLRQSTETWSGWNPVMTRNRIRSDQKAEKTSVA